MVLLSRKSLWITYFIFLFLPCIAYASKWDTELWHFTSFTNWNSGSYRLYTTGEIRLHKNCSEVYYYRITGNLAYTGVKHLDFEFHYSCLHICSLNNPDFHYTHRYEFEANPWYKFNNGVTLRWRNRLEILKRQTTHYLHFIFRHRFLVEVPLKGPFHLEAYRAYDEIHYDFEHQLFFQNRFVPFELVFNLNRESNFAAFVMIRNFFSLSLRTWHRSIVFGGNLSF